MIRQVPVLARRVGIVALLVAIAAHPTLDDAEVETRLTDLEIVLVIDRTKSMDAIDWNGKQTRFQGVRADVAALTDAMPGTRFAVFTFGEDTDLESPFTTDTDTITKELEVARVEGPFSGKGSRLDRAIPEVAEYLEVAERQNPDHRRAVVLMSDGENTKSGVQQSFEPWAEHIDGGLVLGYGTQKGSRIPLEEEGLPYSGFMYDNRREEVAISKLDLDNLEDIAEELGVEALQRTEPGGIDEVVADLQSEAIEPGGTDSGEGDITWLLAIGLFGLVLWELRAGWVSGLSARRELKAGGAA